VVAEINKKVAKNLSEFITLYQIYEKRPNLTLQDLVIASLCLDVRDQKKGEPLKVQFLSLIVKEFKQYKQMKPELYLQEYEEAVNIQEVAIQKRVSYS